MRPWPDQTVTDSDGPGPEPGPGPGPGSSTVAVARAIIWHPMTAAAAFWQRDSDRWQAGVRIREGRLSHRPGRPPLKCRLNFQCGVHPGDPRRPGARRRGTMKVTSTTRKSRCSNALQVLRLDAALPQRSAAFQWAAISYSRGPFFLYQRPC